MTASSAALAIDTAGPVCSVALSLAGRRLSRASAQPRAHARHVLAFVDDVLAEAGVTLAEVRTLAFGEGPGGLTGVRVAASVVQAFALTTGARIAAVSNLHALALRMARAVAPGVRLLVAHEAGAGAVCLQTYFARSQATLEVHDDRQVLMPDDIAWPEGALCVAGSGSGRLSLPAGCAWYQGAPSFADADDLLNAVDAGLARFVEPELAQPVYVRHPVDATITL